MMFEIVLQRAEEGRPSSLGPVVEAVPVRRRGDSRADQTQHCLAVPLLNRVFVDDRTGRQRLDAVEGPQRDPESPIGLPDLDVAPALLWSAPGDFDGPANAGLDCRRFDKPSSQLFTVRDRLPHRFDRSVDDDFVDLRTRRFILRAHRALLVLVVVLIRARLARR